MARPQKPGLDYFPIDVDIDRDDKVAMIEAEYGIQGFGIIVKLFMQIYGMHGYYMMMTPREQKLFAKRINVDLKLLNDVIMLALSEQLFDSEIFGKYGVLTSKGIQKRYIEACNRRKEVSIYECLSLIDVSKYVNVFVDKNPIEGHINATLSVHDVDINPQSKVKESKEYISSSSKTHPDLNGILKVYGEKISDKIIDNDINRLNELLTVHGKDRMLRLIPLIKNVDELITLCDRGQI